MKGRREKGGGIAMCWQGSNGGMLKGMREKGWRVLSNEGDKGEGGIA